MVPFIRVTGVGTGVIMIITIIMLMVLIRQLHLLLMGVFQGRER